MSRKNDLVRQQYEALPYPARDPADEITRLVVGSPSQLNEIEHYIFAGRRAGPLNVLVAGGGTGDGAIMLAQQLADRGEGGQVQYIDLSEASLRIAKARAAARGLDNIQFAQHSLLDVGSLASGPYDYIDCCGVLHHLPEPIVGLQSLSDALNDDGGMGLMLYGKYGRTGVYPMQQAFARLFPYNLPTEKRLAGAKAVMKALPDSNWLKHNAFLGDHILGDDAGFYDLLLHSRDRAYTVSEISTLTDIAGMCVTGFIEQAKYDPTLYLPDGEISKRATKLPWLEQCSLAEELSGSMKTHVFYAIKASNRTGGAASLNEQKNVPLIRDISSSALADAIAKQPLLKANFEGSAFQRKLPASAPDIIRLCDGQRNIKQVRKASGLSDAAFKRDFRVIYDALWPLNLMLLAGRL